MTSLSSIRSDLFLLFLVSPFVLEARFQLCLLATAHFTSLLFSQAVYGQLAATSNSDRILLQSSTNALGILPQIYLEMFCWTRRSSSIPVSTTPLGLLSYNFEVFFALARVDLASPLSYAKPAARRAPSRDVPLNNENDNKISLSCRHASSFVAIAKLKTAKDR